MTTSLINFNKNPNIGLFGFATDKFVLLGKEVPESSVEEVERVLEVPVHRINIAGTSLVGVFVTGNSEKIIIPHITLDSEKKQLEELGINYEVVETNLTCLGNNVMLGEKAAMVNPDMEEDTMKKIGEIFDVKVKKMTIANTETPGSCMIIRKDKALIHRDSSLDDTKEIEKFFGVKAFHSTINLGSPYLKSGILCNEKGLLIGDISGPAEVMNAEEELGYLEDKE